MLDRRKILAGLALCPICATAARAENSHWSYEGTGAPEHWGALNSEFTACSVGAQQSPINLEGAMETRSRAPTLAWKTTPFEVVNNGHTIQLDPIGDAGGAELDGKFYTLRQFHLHTPSEHALNGKRFEAEVHFVHVAEDGNALVVGVFLTPGGENGLFTTVIQAAPAKEGTARIDTPLDITALLPQAAGLFRYQGSLTTPPCAEVVDWNIYADPVKVSGADIDAFRAIFPMNARPLQAINRRFLLKLN